MKTSTKAVLAFGVFVAGVVIAKLLNKKSKDNKEAEQPENEEKEVSTIVFDMEARELSIVKMKPNELCENGKERIGDVYGLQERNVFNALTSKRNAQLIKDSELTVDELRSIWLFALETKSNGAKISDYIQENYLKETAERLKKIAEQEEGH